jgi:hypothetical protein
VAELKEDKFFDPFTHELKSEIHIQRDDIEQAISWFDRLPDSQLTKKDYEVYKDLRKVVAHMRSLDIE